MSRRWLLWILAIQALGTTVVGAQEPAPTEPSPEPPPAYDPPTEPAPADPAAATADDASATGSAGDDVQLTEAELAELGLSGSTEAPAVDTSLKISGFLDFNVSGVVNKRDSPWRGAFMRHPAFYVGSFNLYISKNLTDSIRTFAEVRFSYLPAGNPIDRQTGTYVLTAANDYADYTRPAKWGGIEIERVYLEWAMHRYLSLRVGSFLTPYGIWNVDHGSPTIISFARPFVIGESFFPERQTGFELLGRYQASGSNAVGYHLTLSNGTGALSEFKDFDGNKAVGGRLYWENDVFGTLRVGGSIYYGRDTTAREAAGLNASGNVEYKPALDSQSDSLSLAADIQWRYAGFHIQGELITQQRKYTDKGRVGTVDQALGRFIAPNDSVNWGVYGLVGYRFDWLGIMPYVLYQHMDFVNPKYNNSLMLLNGVNTGLNIRPIPSVVLKIEYLYAKYPNGYILSNDPIHMLQSQLAWAF